MADKKAHVSEEKKQLVRKFANLIDKYEVVAAVDVENLPAPQLNIMRAKLRGRSELVMTKRRLMNIAFEKSKKEGITELSNHLKGMPALLFTNDNPFTLFKTLKKNKSPAPIKAGQITPKDIIVPAGPTNFAPGPIIGELGQFGIKSGVEGGKVAVKQDKQVAKEGDVINATLAGLLSRLGIQPMEIGLNLTAAYENGSILLKKDLDIDEEEFKRRLMSAASDAFRLSVAQGIPLKENIDLLIQNAHRDAKALAVQRNILTSETIGEVLSKAERQAFVLKRKMPEA